MTQINVNINNSGGTAFSGLVRVTLTRPLSTDTALNLTVPVDYPIVNGIASFNLTATQAANIPYKFEVIQTVNVPINNSTTPATPAYSYEVVLDTFNSVVPDSLTPISFYTLVEVSGIFQDNTDASFVSLARRLYYSNGFWSTLQATIFKTRGNYSNSTYYVRGDVVLFNGSSYLNVSSSQQSGVVPSLIAPYTVWFPLGVKGDNGTGTAGNDAVYNATSWDGATDAPSRNAVRDVIETLATKSELSAGYVPKVSGVLTTPTLNANPILTNNSTDVASTAFVQSLIAEIKKAITPIGMIAAWSTASPPLGWLFCDGRVVLRATYPELFTLWGTTFNTGGETALQFRLPDARGRAIAGMDYMSALMGSANRLTSAQMDILGGSIGTETTTITATTSATNSLFMAQGITTSHSEATGYGLTPSANFADRVLVAASTGSVTKGQGQPLTIVQPTLALNIIVYTGVQ